MGNNTRREFERVVAIPIGIGATIDRELRGECYHIDIVNLDVDPFAIFELFGGYATDIGLEPQVCEQYSRYLLEIIQKSSNFEDFLFMVKSAATDDNILCGLLETVVENKSKHMLMTIRLSNMAESFFLQAKMDNKSVVVQTRRGDTLDIGRFFTDDGRMFYAY